MTPKKPEPLLTKRLHISGLTPSITPADLESRLSSFGKVMAMDGFGALDALGDPRKFGFVTMEIGAKELGKCLSMLSGSTWRGAKLRIGEAKPDFRERLAQINSQPPKSVRPKRTRSHNSGHFSSTLPLTPLSATAAASTPGWIATPSGRVVRPMRMRPQRPLEPIRSDLGPLKVNGISGKVKKRAKPPLVRARRRLIDPTKWDSEYLKGVFLDTVPVPLFTSKDAPEPLGPVNYGTADEEAEEETDDDGTDNVYVSSIVGKEIEPLRHPPQLAQDRVCVIQNAQQPQDTVLPTSSRIHEGEAIELSDMRDEANVALEMLGEMFGDDEEWGGKESVTEMEDSEDSGVRGGKMEVGEDDFEIVPRHFEVGEGSKVVKKDRREGKEQSSEEVRFGHEDGVELDVARDRDVEMDGPPVSIEVSAQATESARRPVNLKALFAPREEAPFSLLDHLDLELDLELDVNVLGISAPPGALRENGHPPESLPTSHIVQIPVTMSATKTRSQVTLDPSLPLLFPLPELLPHPHAPSSNPTTPTHRHGALACFLFPSTTRVRGLHHLPPSITFTRSSQDTPESIRERWEKDKSSLTYEWKKAWREARGSKRGRVGIGGEVGGGY